MDRDDIGSYRKDPDVSQKIRDYSARDNSVNLSVLEKALTIGLRRFPELVRGETIHEKEIKQRLSDIKNTGYEIKPYSHMTKEEAWNYLRGLKAKLLSEGEKYLPNVIEKINEANIQQMRDAYLFR